jgi:uncharacterized membrane protein YdbT with pleckstrin-like domain
MEMRRPGYTTGQEQEVWAGSPSLRCTIHLWAISIAIAYFIAMFWDSTLVGMLRSGMFVRVPDIARAMFNPNGSVKTWASLIPWALCLFPAFWYSVQLKAIRYSLTSQRLSVDSGIFVRTHDQLELFRVRDFVIDAPLYMTILGVRHVRIISRDESLPILTLIAQPNAHALIDMVRELVQRRKDEIGLREIETNSA